MKCENCKLCLNRTVKFGGDYEEEFYCKVTNEFIEDEVISCTCYSERD